MLAGVVFVVLYPNPVVFIRHLKHLRQIDRLTDPHDPALAAVSAEFEKLHHTDNFSGDNARALLPAVERFVYLRIPYSWDWQTWGAADYLPSLSEMLAKGREDCDGRAVLAAALLRSRGVSAQLVGDPRHIWVRTPMGDVMQPLGTPAFRFDVDGFHVRWLALLDPGPPAFGIAVFPFERELIILLAAWALLWPRGMGWKAAVLVLILMLAALLVFRLAGADPRAPAYGALGLGGVHLAAAFYVLIRCRDRENWYKHTVRSV